MLLCAKGKILLKNDKTDFTQGRILPKLAFFMLPILGALVLQAAYGAVDLLVVGRFGSTSGLSAVSTGSQVLNLVTFVVTQLAMGSQCSLPAIWAKNDRSTSGKSLAGQRLCSPFWQLHCSWCWCFLHGLFPV